MPTLPTIVGTSTMWANTYPTWYLVASAATWVTFAALATTNQIPLFALPPGGVIHGIKIKHLQSFGGGGITAYTIGVSDGSQSFASPFNVFQPVNSRAYQLSSNFYAEDDISSTQIYATATCVGGNLASATSGIVNIWAELSAIPNRQ